MPREDQEPYEVRYRPADYVQPPFRGKKRPYGYGMDGANSRETSGKHLRVEGADQLEIEDWNDDDLAQPGPDFRELDRIIEGADDEPEIVLSVMNLVRDQVLEIDQLESDLRDGRIGTKRKEESAKELEALRPKVEKRVNELKLILEILRDRDHNIYYSRHDIQGNGALIFTAGKKNASLRFQELLDCRPRKTRDTLPPFISKPSLQNEGNFLNDMDVSALDRHPLSAEEIKIIDNIWINNSGKESPTKLDHLATAMESGGNVSVVDEGGELFLEFQPDGSLAPVRISNADMKHLGVVMRKNDEGERVFMIRRRNEENLSAKIEAAKKKLSQTGKEYINIISSHTKENFDEAAEEAYQTAKSRLENAIKETDEELRETTKAQYVWLEKPIDQVSINNRLIVTSNPRGEE